MTRTPTEMELRVAKVLEPAAFGAHDESRLVPFYITLQKFALMKARHAIRAMRVPTGDMKVAGASVFVTPGRAGNAWSAMIDAASPRTPEEARNDLTQVSQELGLYETVQPSENQ